MTDGQERDMTTGTVVEVSRERWGVIVTPPPHQRFSEDGWAYEEQVQRGCPTCQEPLHSLRKPYTSNGRQYRYVTLVCPACRTCFTLQDLGLKKYAALNDTSDGHFLAAAPPAPPSIPPRDPALTARQAEIVRYWRSVEFFGAQEIKAAKASERRYDVPCGAAAPWEAGHLLQRAPLRSGNVWRHTAYVGIFGLDQMHKTLGRVFTENRTDVDERTPRGQSALFAVEVSPEGRLLLDSVTISQAAWATGRSVRPGPSSSQWLDGFDEAEAAFRARVEYLAQAEADDELARSLRERGVAVSRPVSGAFLHELVAEALKVLLVGDFFWPAGVRVQSHEVGSRRAHEAESDFLNSFFVSDLARVADAVDQADIGAAAEAYLAEDPTESRIDIRSPINHGVVLEMLAPQVTASGRWPTNPEHSLATSQQLAVNQILQRLGSNAGLFGVNGPPGTGKTTMLRDLVASIVVERARQLAQLASPEHAFATTPLGWRTGQGQVRFRPLIPALTGFEVVVASSNNGAVENITKELPANLDEPWEDTGYLRAHARRVHQTRAGRDGSVDQVWGLTAAVLGNRGNRSQFVNALWYATNDAPDGDDLNLRDWLRNANLPPSSWGTAVDSFRAAAAEEERIRRGRQRAHDAVTGLSRLVDASAAATEAAHGAQDTHVAAGDAVVAAETAAAAAAARAQTAYSRRREHLQTKPGWLEVLFTFGSSIRRWHAEDQPLADRQRQLETAEDAANDALAQQRLRLETAEINLTAALTAADTARHHLEAARSAIDAARREMSGSQAELRVPDDAWSRSEDRERLAPWLDVTWNKARTQLFLAALALHETFLGCAGQPIRQLLGAAMDAVKGSIPSDAAAEAHQAAWQALFLVVPVISTTFASTGRMFSDMGSEAIGWLLIDEAGQATPQAAVGAIWRAKRVVAVGDPLQLEPVLTVLHSTQGRLRMHHDVADQWLPGSLSVQTLADRMTSLGTVVTRGDTDLWVGSPLRVHRRCDDPMFSIVNDAVYSGLMIHGDPQRTDPLGVDPEPSLEPGKSGPGRPVPPSTWLHVRTPGSDGAWSPAQGQIAERTIATLLDRYGIAPTDILVLSPFRTVSLEMRKIVRSIPNAQGMTSGTVHVAQGKQAHVVVFVLGAATSGARDWASATPNLMNVAVSRAQHRLYVIGDRDAWKTLPHFSVLADRLPWREMGQRS